MAAVRARRGTSTGRVVLAAGLAGRTGALATTGFLFAAGGAFVTDGSVTGRGSTFAAGLVAPGAAEAAFRRGSNVSGST